MQYLNLSRPRHPLSHPRLPISKFPCSRPYLKAICNRKLSVNDFLLCNSTIKYDRSLPYVFRRLRGEMGIRADLLDCFDSLLSRRTRKAYQGTWERALGLDSLCKGYSSLV